MKAVREKLLPSIVVSILLGSLGLGVRILGVSSELSLIIAGVILILTFTITLIVYRPIRRILTLALARAEIAENGQDKGFLFFRTQLSETIGASSQAEIAKNSGISGWFPSFRESEQAMVNKIQTAKEIRIMTNMGKSDLSKGTRFYEALAANQQLKVKVLLASPKSKFVGPEWATAHQFGKEQSKTWINRIRESIKDIQHIKNHHNIDIEYRYYDLPIVWHFWIIDEKIYVTAWIERTKNVSSVRVIELQKGEGEEKHAYDMFSTFFDRIWHEFSEEEKR